MTPSEWAAHVEAYARKEARARAWECRLHGLKHRSGRALTEEDFLPPAYHASKAKPPLSDAEAAALWLSPPVIYR